MQTITFSVTNDLTYDQRMQRICSSLSAAGYRISIVGRVLRNSVPLREETYHQKRIACWFDKGKLMYAEFNLRLFFYLLFTSSDCFCAIDLDTILPNYFASVIKRRKRVYDAHEWFTQQKEIVTRPSVYRIWLAVEEFAVPKFVCGYTVNQFIADEFKKRYDVCYKVVRNLPKLSILPASHQSKKRFIIYQGAVNEGRSFETLIPAMKTVDAKLVIYGIGNFYKQVQQLIRQHAVEDKVELKGLATPEELNAITPTAYIGIMLFENNGLNQYQSLANRFFDYIMAGIPQGCVDFPQYIIINDQFQVAVLISDTQPGTIAAALNNLLCDDVTYERLRQNCNIARQQLNWQHEEEILLHFYKNLFS